MQRVVTILGVVILLTGVAHADADKAVKEFVEAKKAGSGQVAGLKEAALAKAVPGQAFFSLRFRQYPIAFEAPAGLAASNVLAVGAGDKVTLLSSAKELEAFAKANVTAKDDAAGKMAAAAWLLLSAEIIQDGFYKFQVSEESLKTAKDGDKLVASGRILVTQGGNGEIAVQLTFDATGKLAKVEETQKIRPGPRPICQATLLLHPDPLVRRICEADLLIMGRGARHYLMEQRAKASLELQQAIDRVWQRIERDER
jgi:hypothetical protein